MIINITAQYLGENRLCYEPIVGIDGLYPTCEIIKFTKKIAIANEDQ